MSQLHIVHCYGARAFLWYIADHAGIFEHPVLSYNLPIMKAHCLEERRNMSEEEHAACLLLAKGSCPGGIVPRKKEKDCTRLKICIKGELPLPGVGMDY